MMSHNINDKDICKITLGGVFFLVANV